ncbi:DUF2520 domain-containing protein [Novosphingobium flavum]|uniref:DUF2520 domain-containing protein n=1 Tax=Novosphingobium flavum TaxID=1778672 RepID=A0A7X1KLN0_9SPHN|nr:Rossmann-like and DUF2520 domain-containing protein [Novosphingobium flavum]MBC2665759.1 DUF2520 domain-containing protein [Novosphingobium flavum]
MFRQVGIIGTGRVAQALALGLGAHSVALPLIWGRSPTHCEAAVERVGHCRTASSVAALVNTCDVIAIAVADDAFPGIVEVIGTAGSLAHAPLIFHVSGSTGSAVLDPLCAQGARTAAIHPAMTFTGAPEVEVRRMKSACFAITAPDAAISHARQVVGGLGGTAIEIAEYNRPLYHAALCHAANHLVTLFTGSLRMLGAAGVDDAARVIAPLAYAALENSIAQGFDALSGPVLRGDTKTVRNHLAALEHACPETLPTYRAMALATLTELEREGGERTRSALHRLLDD